MNRRLLTVRRRRKIHLLMSRLNSMIPVNLPRRM
jgi:hypothetical protein